MLFDIKQHNWSLIFIWAGVSKKGDYTTRSYLCRTTSLCSNSTSVQSWWSSYYLSGEAFFQSCRHYLVQGVVVNDNGSTIKRWNNNWDVSFCRELTWTREHLWHAPFLLFFLWSQFTRLHLLEIVERHFRGGNAPNFRDYFLVYEGL